MKFSESWLRTFVNPALSSAELSQLLTMAGLEVEEEEPVAPAFSQVVVAQVLAVEKHANADRLNVCQVQVGEGAPVQIVCGAPNVAAGLKVPCALPGAKLPGDFKIKVAKVRGVESSGMLCSAKELGLAEESSGLLVLPADAPVGEAIRSYLDLDDTLFTLKLTPNRADCLSLTGVAREVSALTGVGAVYPEVTPVAVSGVASRKVQLGAGDACPLYFGRVIRGVDAKAPTPEWMRRRLERSDIRPVSALVDITNYVLLELGQPLHAFDNALLQGDIQVRWGQAGDQLTLLNGQEIAPKADELVIADQSGPLALAGIMGGTASGISLETRELFLESAFFDPHAIAGRARRYSFSTDASHRFERGVDFGGCARAMERASQLILEICGGEAGPLVQAQTELPHRHPVRLRTARVGKVLGVPFTADRIGELLSRLGLSFQREGDDFLVTPPTFRFDIEVEEDLIEEVVRVHGYNEIPARPPKAAMTMLPWSEDQRPIQRLRQILADAGYQEVINFAFGEAAWEADFAQNDSPIRLANPIASQMGVMRTSLIGGLVSTLNNNLKRKQERVRVFETGRCFWRQEGGRPVPGFAQPWKLGGLAYGPAAPEQWAEPHRLVDFFDVKGDLEALLQPAVARFEKVQHPALHPGRAASLTVNGQKIGVIGELHPRWVQKYGLPHAPVVFELELQALLQGRLPQFEELSRFPAVVRDLAVVVDQSLAFQTLLDGLKAAHPPLVKDIQLFDVYTGKGVEEGKKSLALRIVMQDTQKTLQDVEVDAAVTALVQILERQFAAKLRV